MFRSAAAVLLALCFVVMSAPNSVLAAEEGKFKIGALYENEQLRNIDHRVSFSGNYAGVVLGYEKQQDDFWWALDGRYKYGQLKILNYHVDVAKIEGQGIVGKTYDINGFELKPYAGLRVSWEAQDEAGTKDTYNTEYILPVGVRLERNTNAGLFGVDLQYAYLIGREIYTSNEDPFWGRRFFDGSHKIEAGIYYESADFPVGVRPYFRFESYQKTKYWSQRERHLTGIEAYVKF